MICHPLCFLSPYFLCCWFFSFSQLFTPFTFPFPENQRTGHRWMLLDTNWDRCFRRPAAGWCCRRRRRRRSKRFGKWWWLYFAVLFSVFFSESERKLRQVMPRGFPPLFDPIFRFGRDKVLIGSFPFRFELSVWFRWRAWCERRRTTAFGGK